MTFDLVSYTRTPFRMSNDYKKKLIRTRYSTAVNDYQKRGIVALREKNAVLRAELARRDETIARLKEDADALYYSILHQEFGETKYQSRAVDAHRALMKELKEEK